MIPIIISNIGDLADEFNLSNDDIKKFGTYAVQELSSKFMELWQDEALNSDLKSTKQQYFDAIRIEKISEDTVVVKLEGFIPNAIEQGVNAFDLKESFSKSDKRMHVDSRPGGWYLTIPFRWATPSAVATSGAFSNKIPDEVFKVVKNKIKSGDNSALKLGEIPKGFEIPKIKPPIELESKRFEGYEHKAPIYQGIKQTGGGYTTFRRISDVSMEKEGGSWIHPGFTEKDLAGKAINELDIPNFTDKLIDKFLINL